MEHNQTEPAVTVFINKSYRVSVCHREIPHRYGTNSLNIFRNTRTDKFTIRSRTVLIGCGVLVWADRFI